MTVNIQRPANRSDWHISRSAGPGTVCGKVFVRPIVARTSDPMSVECEACRNTVGRTNG